VIVVTKSDLLTPDGLGNLMDRLATEFPGKRIISMSVRTGERVGDWFDLLKHSKPVMGPAMQIDYDIYADGEALLGWLNATVKVSSAGGIDSAVLLQTLAGEIQRKLESAEIAHLKMTFSPDDSLAGEIAALSVVRNDLVPELTLRLDEPVTNGEAIVNCRAEAAPELLRAALESGLRLLERSFPEGSFKLEHAEQFRPGRPQPTHRLGSPEESLTAA
jgi:hypothetical protein